MSALENFQLTMIGPNPFREPGEIGALLAACLRRACDEGGLTEAEIYDGGPLVTMFFTPAYAWEAVIVGPDAYQFYPGFLGSDGVSITWANVWVTDDYNLEKFISAIEHEFETARAEAVGHERH